VTPPRPDLRGTDWRSGSSLTPEVWWRLLDALNAGTPQDAACLYAGISPAVWEREKQRIPEFGTEAHKIEMSGLVAAWRFVQMAAASEWRAAAELIKLYGATRGRAGMRPDEPGSDDPDADITPADVAAVIRVLRAHEVSDGGAADGNPNGHAAGANGGSEAVE
jgi:hypothetical protein